MAVEGIRKQQYKQQEQAVVVAGCLQIIKVECSKRHYITVFFGERRSTGEAFHATFNTRTNPSLSKVGIKMHQVNIFTQDSYNFNKKIRTAKEDFNGNYIGIILSGQ